MTYCEYLMGGSFLKQPGCVLRSPHHGFHEKVLVRVSVYLPTHCGQFPDQFCVLARADTVFAGRGDERSIPGGIRTVRIGNERALARTDLLKAIILLVIYLSLAMTKTLLLVFWPHFSTTKVNQNFNSPSLFIAIGAKPNFGSFSANF